MMRNSVFCSLLFVAVCSQPFVPSLDAGPPDTSGPEYRILPRDKEGMESLLEVETIQVSFSSSPLDSVQSENFAEVLEVSQAYGANPFAMVAIAFRESSFRKTAVSPTGDVGIFQINYRWWGKELGYKNYEDFLKHNTAIKRNTRHAIEILRIFSRHRACLGENLYACYNGGYGWRKSPKRRQIEFYRDRVVKTIKSIERGYPQWGANPKSH